TSLRSIRSSSSVRRRCTVGWLTPRAFAAERVLPSRATARKKRWSFQSNMVGSTLLSNDRTILWLPRTPTRVLRTAHGCRCPRTRRHKGDYHMQSPTSYVAKIARAGAARAPLRTLLARRRPLGSAIASSAVSVFTPFAGSAAQAVALALHVNPSDETIRLGPL